MNVLKFIGNIENIEVVIEIRTLELEGEIASLLYGNRGLVHE